MSGWIKLHRKIQDNWIWKEKPFDKKSAWIDLILMANHKEKKFLLGNELVEVDRGSFITSEYKLMDKWGWSKTKVRSFLELLQNENMIIKCSDRKKTTITIVNYSDYQISETTEELQKDYKKTTKRLQKNPNKNDKNDKNIYNEQAEQIYSLYPNKKGKAIAMKKIPDLIKQYGHEKIESCVKRYAAEVAGKDQKYIKHASTFFTSGYMDYLEEEKPKQKEKSNIDPLTGEVLDYWKYC